MKLGWIQHRHTVSRGTSLAERAAMRIHIVSATIIASLCGVPFHAAAQSVCMKPWAIPDKWTDNHDETEPIDQIWTLDDTFETVDAHGAPLSDADVYDQTRGFSSADIGRRVWLKVGDVGSATRGSFFALDIGGTGGGADAYKTAIATCDPAAPHFVNLGDSVPVLMGNLHGPTLQGVADMISQDVDASWDDATRSIVSTHLVSPRLGVIAAIDPAEYEQSSVSNPPRVRVTNLLGFFVEGYVNGYVIGVLAPIPAP
jgi:hypothetical protein